MKTDKFIIAIFSLLIVIIGSITVGFFIGRSTIDTKTEIKYVKGETIIDTVYIPSPYAENKPTKDKLVPIYKKDSTGIESSELDTAKSKDATIADWNLERKYANTLFNNEYGNLSYDISVQNNKLSSFKYTHTPIQKQTNIYKEKVWQPYASASYSTLNYVGVGLGLFYHDIGFEIRYITDFDKKGVDFGLKYKF